jgi:hypothetical protein
MTHSKVRTSNPGGPDAIPVNIIGPWQFGQGGRSIAARPGSNETRACDMMLALDQAGAQHSQSPVDANKGGDGNILLFEFLSRWSILLTFRKIRIGKMPVPRF